MIRERDVAAWPRWREEATITVFANFAKRQVKFRDGRVVEDTDVAPPVIVREDGAVGTRLIASAQHESSAQYKSSDAHSDDANGRNTQGHAASRPYSGEGKQVIS